jgi:hypothetical protein
MDLGELRAVDAIGLDLPRGRVAGFVGPLAGGSLAGHGSLRYASMDASISSANVGL